MATLKKLLTQKLQPIGSDTVSGQIEDIRRAKTGRESVQRGPQTTGLGAEQTAVEVERAGRAGQLEGAQIARDIAGREREIQSSVASQEKQALDKFTAFKSQALQNSTQIINELRRGREKMDVAKFRAKAEQAGFNLRLSSEKYIDKLQRAGKLSRLESGEQFKEALYKSMFADTESLFRDETVLKQLASADDREFARQLNQVDIDFAIKLGKMASASASAKQTAGAIGGLASAAGKTIEKNPQWFTDDKPDTEV